eukprot:jgi/Chlat1/2914/Chrsp2S04637
MAEVEEEVGMEEMDDEEEDGRVLYGSDGDGNSDIGLYAASDEEGDDDNDGEHDALTASLLTAAASPPNDQRSNGRGEDWLLRTLRVAPSTPPYTQHALPATIAMKQPTPAHLRLSESRALSFSPGSPHSIELDNESAFLTPKAVARRVLVDEEDARGLLSASLSTMSTFWSNNNNSKGYANVKYDARK